MKHRVLILCACSTLLFSCGNSYDEANSSEEEVKKEVVLETNLSTPVVETVINNIDVMLSKEISSRTVGGSYAISEEEAKEQLKPFVEEGKRLRNEILADMRANPTSYPAGSGIVLLNMTDDQLAEFGFSVYDYETNPKLILYGTSPWLDCLADAFGIGKWSLSQYISGTKTLMTARTGLVIAKAFAKRTLGWIGVAIAVYDYSQCMKGK